MATREETWLDRPAAPLRLPRRLLGLGLSRWTAAAVAFVPAALLFWALSRALGSAWLLAAPVAALVFLLGFTLAAICLDLLLLDLLEGPAPGEDDPLHDKDDL